MSHCVKAWSYTNSGVIREENMNVTRILGRTLVVFALANLVVPLRLVVAASPTSQDFKVHRNLVHVSLNSDKALVGQVLDDKGQPLANHPVALYETRNPQPKAGPAREVATDSQGRFEFPKLNGDAYIVVADESVTVCRCWLPGLAPPAAKSSLMMVADHDIQRGQNPIGEMLFGNPFILILLIAAAIAIPIAIHNSRDKGS